MALRDSFATKDATAGLDHKTSAFELKELKEDGSFEGYGSVFGELDNGNDIVVKGAFRRSLKERKPKMLFQHDPDTPIGVWDEVKEDTTGLYCKGKLIRESAKGAECYALLKAGALDGLSIGYQTVRAERDERSGVRTLKEVNLWEVSIVTFPMLVSARVSNVKKDWTERSIERLLREGGVPDALARVIVSHGVKSALERLGAPREVDDGRELLAAISRLTQQMEGR